MIESRRTRTVSSILAACALVFTLVFSGTATAQTPAADSGPTLTAMPDAAPRAGSPLKVVATTPLLADVARQIGGSRVDVTAILPANADPHDFEPAPADLVEVEGAELIIEHGLSLDTWASDLVKNADAKAPVLIATKDVPTIASPEQAFADGDPHIWFDPRNIKIVTRNIAAAMIAADPDGAPSYTARADAYAAQLDALDGWIGAQIATIPADRRKLVTNHDAFGYYIARYGLTFVGTVIPGLSTNAEPSAKETADLIDTIKAEKVPAIFTESSINPKLENELGRQAGVAVVPNLYGDNLGDAQSGAATYIAMMVTDTRLIVDALR